MSPSNGPQIIQSLQENLDHLSDETGAVEPKDFVLYNISNALIGIYQDIEAEFRNLNARLTKIEQQLRR